MNLKQMEVNMCFSRDLETHLQLLQKQLSDNTYESQEERDRTHLSNQFLFQTGLQNQRAVREVNNIPLLHEHGRSALVRVVS
jgi:hypothetical protein